jgi:hypothetical protein
LPGNIYFSPHVSKRLSKLLSSTVNFRDVQFVTQATQQVNVCCGAGSGEEGGGKVGPGYGVDGRAGDARCGAGWRRACGGGGGGGGPELPTIYEHLALPCHHTTPHHTTQAEGEDEANGALDDADVAHDPLSRLVTGVQKNKLIIIMVRLHENSYKNTVFILQGTALAHITSGYAPY